MHYPLTQAAKRVLEIAKEEAAACQSSSVLPEHLLLAILLAQDGRAYYAMRDYFIIIDDKRMSHELRKRIGAATGMGTLEKLSFAPDTTRILEIADSEASSQGHSGIGTDDLLAALYVHKDNKAVEMLNRYGFVIDLLRRQFERLPL